MITHTNWIRDILLLLFQVPTCRLACQPIQSGAVQYTIVDDNVEVAPIYRCNGKAGQPIVRPHKNHDLCIEWEPMWTESQQKQQIQSRAVLHLDHWTSPKSREHNRDICSVVGLRFGPVAKSLYSLMDLFGGQ